MTLEERIHELCELSIRHHDIIMWKGDYDENFESRFDAADAIQSQFEKLFLETIEAYDTPKEQSQ